VGQVLNSQEEVRGDGVVVEDPVPDLLTAGADKTTLSRREKPLLLKDELPYVVLGALQGVILRTNQRNSPPVVIGQDYIGSKDGLSEKSEERGSLK
jgi:hypothetical protein